MLKPNQEIVIDHSLRLNNITTLDSIFEVFQQPYESFFFDIENTDKHEYESLSLQKFFENSTIPLLEINFEISDKYLMHGREVYDLITLVGDLGGVIDVFIFIFGILVNPINFHSFSIKSLKKLYIARTIDKDIFKIELDQNENKKKCTGKTKFKVLK